MPIDIKKLNEKKDVVNRNVMLAENMYNFLKANSDKAFSTLDLQVEFKCSYTKIRETIKTLLTLPGGNISVIWSKLEGYNRMRYFSYKNVLKEDEQNEDRTEKV